MCHLEDLDGMLIFHRILLCICAFVHMHRILVVCVYKFTVSLSDQHMLQMCMF